ncbi:MAG: hypothetical protein HEQ40_06355 [Lacibacter sp.]|jgi:periplasmic protein TonB
MKKIFTLLFTCLSSVLFAQQKDSVMSAAVSQIDTTLFTKVDVEASFPGGDAAWAKYVQTELEKHINKLSRNKASVGTCVVQFIVDKEGNITNVVALNMQESLLAKIVMEAIQKGPRWVPAEQNGRKVKAYRRQKITFLPPK